MHAENFRSDLAPMSPPRRMLIIRKVSSVLTRRYSRAPGAKNSGEDRGKDRGKDQSEDQSEELAQESGPSGLNLHG